MELIHEITRSIHWLLSDINIWIRLLTNESSVFNILLPLFCIGIGVSLVMVIIKLIRRITWGS